MHLINTVRKIKRDYFSTDSLHAVKKLFTLFIISSFTILLTLFTPGETKALEELDVNSIVEYEVQRDGKTKVINDITITNLNSKDYAKTFNINILAYEPGEIKAYEGDLLHDTELITNGSKSTIVVNFSNSVVGIGNKRIFTIEYSLNDLATETGEIWEIVLPKLENPSLYSNYTAILSLPKSLGELAYISPVEDSFKEDDEIISYVFSKDKITSSSITAGFGEFQVFSFELNYHIENPNNSRSTIEIALPPDTSTQTILYESIDPVPAGVVVDTDGNWIASYVLDKRQRLDIKAVGKVQIFAAPRRIRDITEEVYKSSLEVSEYWEVDNVKIKNFADRLKTPKKIYEFTKSTLTYDYSRVTPNVERKGALSALENPKNAICMEFTDLFIALSRAAGIPAREINGFAYTENPELQPLSLVADVLHSWPEYWDNEKKVWIPVDPTWGSTSSQDYFESFDLRHFAFVIHGKDPEKPYSVGTYKLGEEPIKDVYVEFGEIENISNSEVKLTHTKHLNNPLTGGQIKFLIHNSGPKAIYSVSPKIYFDNVLVGSQSIDVLPPFSSREIIVDIEKGVIMKNTPDIVSLSIDQINLDVQTNKNLYILVNLTIITFMLAVITFILFTKIRKHRK